MGKLFEPIGYRNDSEIDTNRYSGGANSKTHSAVKGYFYVLFSLPNTLFGQNYNADYAQNHLLTNAIQFTPHGDAQMNIAEEKGIGGVTANFLTGVSGTNEFNLTFRERHELPVWKTLNIWGSYMNPFLGASCVAKNFDGSEYKGIAMVIQTKPVARGNGVECTSNSWSESDLLQVYIYDGVFPTIRPSSVFDSSIESNELIQLSVPFKFDGEPLSIANEGVAAQAVQVLNNMDAFNKTSKKYTELLDKAATL